MVEFDKLKRDYQEHQNEIRVKLIAIIGDRITAHIKRRDCHTTQEEYEPPSDEPVAHQEYIVLISSSTLTQKRVFRKNIILLSKSEL